MSLFRTKEVVPSLGEAEQQLVENYTSCLGGPAGDYVMQDLYYFAKLHTTVFGEAEFDPLRAAHLDGMQTVVKRMLNLSGRTFKP